ncbi:MAG: MmcQ/YjbR family DNA-binding protein [Bacteroidota bacterium]
MNYDSLREYCLSKPGTTEGLPFGPDTLVFKVMGKMFAVAGLDEIEPRVNLKCDPERAVELRETYPEGIIPGWHMNKHQWNTVYLERGLNETLLLELIDHSYELVVKGLPRRCGRG